jgi:hypothetical protein
MNAREWRDGTIENSLQVLLSFPAAITGITIL